MRLPVDTLIALIQQHRGNLAAIGRSLKTDRTNVLKYVRRSPLAIKALDEAREAMIDDAESAFYTNVLNGNVVAQIFFLKTKARHRGWIEHHDVHLTDDVNVEQLTNAELEAIASRASIS